MLLQLSSVLPLHLAAMQKYFFEPLTRQEVIDIFYGPNGMVEQGCGMRVIGVIDDCTADPTHTNFTLSTSFTIKRDSNTPLPFTGDDYEVLRLTIPSDAISLCQHA